MSFDVRRSSRCRFFRLSRLIKFNIVYFCYQNDETFNGSGVFSGFQQFILTILQLLLKLIRYKNFKEIMTELPCKMSLSKRNLTFMVLLNVLLISCGYANARPNLETNLIDHSDETNVSKFIIQTKCFLSYRSSCA